MKRGLCIALHGGDHKTGVTMLSQCIAEHMTEHLEEQTVIQVGLHGNPGGDYTSASVRTVEELRSYLEQNLFNAGEILRDCKVTDRQYLVRGITRPEQQRLYHPKLAQYLVEQLREQSQYVVVDTGSEADNGLAIGGLQAADIRCLVLTQQESVIARWERNQSIYRRLGIDFQMVIVNRYLPESAYTKEYLAERLEFPADRILTVSDSPYGLKADNEKKSLIQYKDERIRQGIRGICQRLTEHCGVDYPEEKRWKRWKKGFI